MKNNNWRSYSKCGGIQFISVNSIDQTKKEKLNCDVEPVAMLMVPRKNSLGYFSIAMLRKLGMLSFEEKRAWKETSAFYNRDLTIEKKGNVYLAAKNTTFQET